MVRYLREIKREIAFRGICLRAIGLRESLSKESGCEMEKKKEERKKDILTSFKRPNDLYDQTRDYKLSVVSSFRTTNRFE